MGIRHLGLVAVLGLGLTACWRHNTPPTPAGGHDLITLHELERVSDMTLFDAVRQLRPHFLRTARSIGVDGDAHFFRAFEIDASQAELRGFAALPAEGKNRF